MIEDAKINPTLDNPITPVARRLGIASLYVVLGNAYTLVVGLPLQIYVSHVLGPDGVGVYGLLEAVVTTIAAFLDLGIGSVTIRFLPAYLQCGEYGKALGLVRLGGTILITVGIVAYGIMLLSLPWIGTLWPEVTVYRKEIAIMGLLIPLGLLTYFLQQSLRGFQEIRHIVLGSVLQLSSKTVLTLGAFAIGLRLYGYVSAMVLGTLCGFLWLLYQVHARTRILSDAEASTSEYSQWYRYAFISFSAGSLVVIAETGLDRFLVGGFIGSGAVGVLLIARQLQSFPERFNQMLLMIGAPLLSAAYGRHDHRERQHIYCLMTDWSVRCSLPLVLFFIAYGHPVLALYGPEFANRGTLPLQILVAAQFFGSLCGPLGNVALMSGLERHYLFITIASALLLAVLLFVLIPHFGLVGAAIAIASSILFVNLGTMFLVKRKLNLHWWDKRYRAWLPQAGANLLLVLLVCYLPLNLGAIELLMLLATMYALALFVSIPFGMHEDDRDLFSHVWAEFQRFLRIYPRSHQK